MASPCRLARSPSFEHHHIWSGASGTYGNSATLGKETSTRAWRCIANHFMLPCRTAPRENAPQNSRSCGRPLALPSRKGSRLTPMGRRN